MAATSRRPRASTEKTRPSVFWPLAAVVAPLIALLFKLEIEGAENLPREGAYVLAPNHYSESDPLAVALAVWKVGRAPRFMAKESLFHVPVLGWILRVTGMVPVARSSSAASARQTLETSETLVELGRVVIGKPVDLTAYRTTPTQPAALVAATDTVMADIAQLLSTIRKEPAPAQRWNPADHGQKE